VQVYGGRDERRVSVDKGFQKHIASVQMKQI
jgi:hypothetical protein